MQELVYARGTAVALPQRCSRIKEQSNRKFSDLTIIYILSFGRRRVLSSSKKKRKKVMYKVVVVHNDNEITISENCDFHYACSLCATIYEHTNSIELRIINSVLDCGIAHWSK